MIAARVSERVALSLFPRFQSAENVIATPKNCLGSISVSMIFFDRYTFQENHLVSKLSRNTVLQICFCFTLNCGIVTIAYYIVGPHG